MLTTDVAIVGGGIVGLATAWQLLHRYPQLRVTVLEKEANVGGHQTGHNSGVLHSGIYYKPGSLRALNCRTGKAAMEQFCQEHGVPYDICGKVIVAVNEQELPRLDTIFERGQQNGVRCEVISRERLLELEPHTAGIKAIHVPEAGIVNYAAVTRKLAELLPARNGQVLTGWRVTKMHGESEGVVIVSDAGEIMARHVVTCGGLHSDRLAKLTGHPTANRIVPFRGEYYDLKPNVQHLCRNLIYPVPDPNFPFLGVHFTRMIEGGVECGPNAVLAFAREGYRKLDINMADLLETLTYGGFLKLAAKYWRTGAGEMWRSWSKAAFVRALQHLIPEIKSEDLVAARTGVRAQAIAPDGMMIDDFLIEASGRYVNVLNAPSPAATSSLNVGKLIVDKLAERL
ncbi:L-2-hydroxyglutarate oxidase LhgO [Anatilimnocola aggregata]|uniref:L-2-hydroxyglutarate oxidase LhgO n=1 Tax=Anatilimnocola aggregata TaxID=2528021 RepID=A0A517YJM6_9BACT|nr:L-2-hydroxyglutarate oxidase [Anatilimnocola aggregata]QDU30417.1 L-2-hydroxyglutarate oxidase LhgO [Anatilimnocola aggregata]